MLRKSLLILSLSLLVFVAVANGAEKTQKEAAATEIRSKPNVLAALKTEREARIAALKEYVKSGKFPWGKKGEKAIGKDDPHFDHQHERTHRFRGPNGELCALAFLIWQSGDKDLVNEIVKNDNHFCLGKDKNPKVEAWILRSGLTKEECLEIQRPGFRARRNKKLPPKLKAIAVVTEAEQKAQLRKLLKKVIVQLEKNSDASLKIAKKRMFTPVKKS